MRTARPHWLFADQLGPQFLAGGRAGPDDPGGPVVLIECRSVLRRRVFHRAKAHLFLSALRHRAAELGDRARYVRADTYREGLRQAVGRETVTVHHPTSRAALALVRSLPRVEVLPARGFLTDFDFFRGWADGRGRRRLLLEDFYRSVREYHEILIDGEQPVGGRWNLDADNRERPPRDAARLPVDAPWWPQEDEIDEEVRADLDRWEREGELRFLGRDGPRRFAVTRAEAQQALAHFLARRLPDFGRWEDAMLSQDPWMAHSLLSVPLNLGLLDPLECVRGAEDAYRSGAAPLNSVEGFVRQIAGWREYVWQLYWYADEDWRDANVLGHRGDVPVWFADLDADAVEAACLRHALAQVRASGWTHHIPRLMLLGNWALQHGWDPRQVTDWFHRAFVDGYDWVMVPNVVGMSQYADGGRMTTKPYTAGGAYIHRMSDFCGSCRYSPRERTGPNACPFTAGYWSFVADHSDLLASNPRTARAVAGLRRLPDLEALLAGERRRGDAPP